MESHARDEQGEVVRSGPKESGEVIWSRAGEVRGTCMRGNGEAIIARL